MSFPTAGRYHEAVQAPHLHFLVDEINQRRVQEDALGLPEVLSGGFAFTYKFVGPTGNLAVRCFHKAIPELFKRYQEISAFLGKAKSRFFVQFAFYQTGVRIDGKIHPVVTMDWIEGDTLVGYLIRQRLNPTAIGKLRGQLLEFSDEATRLGYAHGDIQHRNIVIARDGDFKLVDYDGMYVPALSRLSAADFGHLHFQHPLRSATDFGPAMDRFPLIVLDLSLAALQANTTLFDKYHKGEYLILSRPDFDDPNLSPVLKEIAGLDGLASLTGAFCDLCSQSPASMPTLREFRSQTGRLNSTVSERFRNTSVGQTPYASPYTVVDGMDYRRAKQFIGQPIELIGQVQRVINTNSGTLVLLRFGQAYTATPTIVLPGATYAKLFASHNLRSGNFWISATGVLQEHSYRNNRTVQIFAKEVSDINILPGKEEADYRLGKKPINSRKSSGGDIPSWLDDLESPNRNSSPVQPPAPLSNTERNWRRVATHDSQLPDWAKNPSAGGAAQNQSSPPVTGGASSIPRPATPSMNLQPKSLSVLDRLKLQLAKLWGGW